MGYNDLSQSTLTAEERVSEKDRILEILEDLTTEFTPKELDFIASMQDAVHVSIKQIYFLRDILGKYQ